MTNWQDILYPCTFDHTLQHAMFRPAAGKEPRPLLVALHTWSGDYTQNCSNYGDYCVQNNWTFIFPDFRGPNWLPDACGSDAVVQDIADAVAFAKSAANVDSQRVYLIGGSGGGHASLLLAARRPDLWTAVSSWCPISDVGAWHNECINTPNKDYAEHIRKACGGDPGNDPAVHADAWKRSPLCYMENASRTLLDISTGIHDGHTGSVPVSQAINAFNALAKPQDKLSREDIDFILNNEKIPEKLGIPEIDPSFGDKYKVLFRRQSNLARLTLFEGGHNLLEAQGLDWLARQSRNKTPDWSVGNSTQTHASELAK